MSLSCEVCELGIWSCYAFWRKLSEILVCHWMDGLNFLDTRSVLEEDSSKRENIFYISKRSYRVVVLSRVFHGFDYW